MRGGFLWFAHGFRDHDRVIYAYVHIFSTLFVIHVTLASKLYFLSIPGHSSRILNDCLWHRGTKVIYLAKN